MLVSGLLLAVLVLAVPGLAVAQSPTPTTTIENGNADTRFQLNYDGGLYVPGTFFPTMPADSIPATGAGTRLMWYPAKAAFRAGRVGANLDGTQWDAAKVGTYSTAFGLDTKASGSAATAMSFSTTASAFGATAMGEETTASGVDATAMGFQTTASGTATTAMGDGTTASGAAATAMGDATTASGKQATAMGRFTTASGVTATTLGNFTTAATDGSLSIGNYNSANTSADGTLFVAGNGSGSSSRSDALVLKQDGDLAVGPSDPQDLRLHVAKDKPNAGVGNSPGANMVLFENTATGDKPDVLGLQAGPSSPGNGVTYVSFYTRSGTTIGAIEGNGSGGVNYNTTGADFAEELPVAGDAPVPDAGDLVGVRGGEVRRTVGEVDRLMIVSGQAAMTGNVKPNAAGERVPVAFVGQVPVRLRGPAEVGDLIVASGENDGTARAVAPSEYRRSTHGPVAGQAWSAKSTGGIGEVTVAVGLSNSDAVAERLESQRERMTELEAENEAIKSRLAALERQRPSSLPAGLVGPWALTVLLGLGALGAGLLWRCT